MRRQGPCFCCHKQEIAEKQIAYKSLHTELIMVFEEKLFVVTIFSTRTAFTHKQKIVEEKK